MLVRGCFIFIVGMCALAACHELFPYQQAPARADGAGETDAAHSADGSAVADVLAAADAPVPLPPDSQSAPTDALKEGVPADHRAHDAAGFDTAPAVDAALCPAWCDGCCTTIGTCKEGTDNAFCGQDGDPCQNCQLSDMTCNAATGGCEPGCTPACQGKCDGAGDGCGGTCSANDCPGCCDTLRACHSGTTAQACGLGGQACATCGNNESCQNGNCFCAPSCDSTCPGDPDGCGSVCQVASGATACQTNNTYCAGGQCHCDPGFSSCGREVAAWGCNCDLSTHLCTGFDQCDAI